MEARRRLNVRGAIKQREREEMPESLDMPADFPSIPEPTTETTPEPEPPATEPEVEPAVVTEPIAVPPEPTPPVTVGRPSRVTKKPIRFGDYECHPCEVEPKDTGIASENAQQVEKMPSQRTEAGPAASRVSLPPPSGQIRGERWTGVNPEGVPQLPTPLETITRVEGLCQKEWPALTVRRRNIKKPATSRLASLAS